MLSLLTLAPLLALAPWGPVASGPAAGIPPPVDALSEVVEVSGKLTVNVTGVESAEGQIIVVLWNDGDGFPSDVQKAYRRVTARPQGGGARVQVPNVPPGRYAVMAFHDMDGNGAVKTNFIGLPKEPVGLSNYSGGRPRFDRSLITIGANSVVSVELRSF